MGVARGRLRQVLASPILAGGGLVLFSAVGLVNVGNFAFHAIASRELGPARYGSLGSLLGIIVLLQVPAAALEVSCTRVIAGTDKGALDIRPTALRLVWTALVVMAALTALSPWLRQYLHLDNVWEVVLTGVVMACTISGLGPKSALLGRARFRPVAGGLALGAVLKIGSAALLLAAHPSVIRGLLAMAIGEGSASLCYAASARDSIRAGGRPVRIPLRETLGPTVAFAGFWALSSTDVLLARHYLHAAESGLYAAAATAAKIVLFAPSAVALIAFPRLADAGTDHIQRRRVLRDATGLTVVLAVGGATMLSVAPHLVVSVLFGPTYQSSVTGVRVLGWAAVALSVLNVLLYYLLATRSRFSGAAWLGVAAAVVVGFVRHGTVEQIAVSMVVVDGLLTVVVLLRSWLGADGSAAVFEDGPLWAHARATVDLSVVVPGPPTPGIHALADTLREAGESFEIIAVYPGATDIGAVRGVPAGPGTPVGTALRAGLCEASGAYVGVLDPQGSIDPESFLPFLAVARLYTPDLVVGSKRHPMSQVDWSLARRWASAGYHTAVRALFRIGVTDTQTGIKLVRREVLAAALPRTVEHGLAFDLELIVAAHELGYRKFFEAPIRIQGRLPGRLPPRAAIGAVRQMAAIFYRARALHYYERDIAPVAPAPRVPV